jgi:hypothetical protein
VRHCSYSNLKKADLEVALDDYLRANSTTYNKEPSLSDYYKRQSGSSRSPVKKSIAEKVSDIVKSDDDAPVPVKKARRKTTTANEIRDTT